MIEDTQQTSAGGASRWLAAGALACIYLFHAINTWIWLSKNALTRGWDPIGALINGLYYNNTLSSVTLQTLFRACTQDEYRPPLFGLSMALMYKLFGLSADVAVMANVVYLLVLVVAVYGLGTRLGGRRLGLLSAFLATFAPLVFAMTRYAFFEFALTALTALNIYLLLACEHFQNRRVSIVLGLALGLGALLKRTFPVYIAGALLVVFFQAQLPQKLWARLRARPHPRWRDLGIALVGGLLLSALWYLPNREAAQAFTGSAWLFPLWAGLVAAAIFFALQPSSPETNFLACGTLTMAVASVWYLPRGLEFVKQILWLAWGVEDPRGRTVVFTSLSTYTEYLQSILYGFSPVFCLLFLLAVVLLAIGLLCRRPRLALRRWLASNWWVVIASTLVAYAILSTSIYKEPRAITPLLPLLGVVMAGVLLKLPWRPVRIALIALVVVFGLVQFFAISYTEAHGLVKQTNFHQPILGQRGLFAQGTYLEVPDSGLNDPGYYIAGDVLRQVEATRLSEGWDSISLGIMAGSSQVNVGMFVYDQLRLYPNIQIENPVQAYPQESPYSMAYRYDYLAILSTHNRGEAMSQAVDLILGERHALFERAFEQVAVYPLPDGSDVYLFRRRYRPAGEYSDDALYEAAQYLHQNVTAQDLVVVDPARLLPGLLESYWGAAPVATVDQLPAGDPLPSHVFVVTGQGTAMDARLARALEGYRARSPAWQFGGLQVVTFKESGP